MIARVWHGTCAPADADAYQVLIAASHFAQESEPLHGRISVERPPQTCVVLRLLLTLRGVGQLRLEAMQLGRVEP
jgi:hypothetical protein